jgi:hypothetical protein
MINKPEEEKFHMNGTSRKINLFNQALAKVIEDKIMIKEDSLQVKQTWQNYKDSGFLTAKNRHDLCEAVTGAQMDTRETVQTTIKKVYQQIIDNIPGVLGYFDFHNMDNGSNLLITRKIYEEDKPSKNIPDGQKTIGVTAISLDENESMDDEANDWNKVKGNFTPTLMMTNPKTDKEGSQKNQFEELDESDDISELYNEDLDHSFLQETKALKQNSKKKNDKPTELKIPLLGVNTLCNEINNSIELYLDTNPTPNWMHIWTQWKDNDFIKVDNVLKLAVCVEAPSNLTTLKMVFDHMSTKIEYIHDSFQLRTYEDQHYLIETIHNTMNLKSKNTTKNNEQFNFSNRKLNKEESNKVGHAIAKGNVHDLDINLLCNWIMNKGNEVQKVCDMVERVAHESTSKMENTVAEDSRTILNTIEKAARKYSDQMLEVTKEAKDDFLQLQTKVDSAQTKAHTIIKSNQRNIDLAKGELKKAEHEGIIAVNKTANNHIKDINTIISKSTDLIDKLKGTHSITNAKQKEIDNMMIILQKRIHGATDKFEEMISLQSDNERVSFINWMNKRLQFMQNKEGEGDTIQLLMSKYEKLIEALDLAAKERMKLNAERTLLEADRHSFQQWWDAIKGKFDQPTIPEPINTGVRETRSETYQSSSSPSSVYIDQEQHRFTFKMVDKHNDNPTRSPTHGKVDQELPQPNQQIHRVDHFTVDEFPPEVCNPLQHGTHVQYNQNIFKYMGQITYEDNLPSFINDTWYYDIITTRQVKLINCSGKYITEVEETLPEVTSNGQHMRHSRGDYLPPQQSETRQNDISPPDFQTRNDERASRHDHSNHDSHQRNDNPPQRHQYQSRHGNTDSHQRPWVKPRLAANEFIYPKDTHPSKVQHHDIIKYGNKWDLEIQSKEEFRMFYENLRNQMNTYNVYLIDYDKIELDKSLTEITPDNCENYTVAVTEMSRALFNFFTSNKDTIFKNYKEPVNTLETYRPYSNGFGFLMNMMKRIHPTLKRTIITNEPAITPMPQFEQYTTIHKFINALVAYRKDELQSGRRFSDKELLMFICKSLDERFSSATYKIKKELKDSFSNPSCPQPIPAYLTIDNELAIRIMDLIDDDDRDQDFNNLEPTSRAQINKANYNGYNRDRNYRNDSTQDNRRSSQYNKQKDDRKATHKSKDETWADTLKWEIIEGAECAGCRRNNHDVYRTGCPAFAQFALCQEFYKTVPSEQLSKVKNAFLQHQKSRRLAMSKKKKEYRSTIKALQADPDYEEDVIEKIRKTFFHKYKEEFHEERQLESNPFEEGQDTIVTEDV